VHITSKVTHRKIGRILQAV